MASIVIAQFVQGTPRLGIWCDKCLLSSRFEFDVFLLDDDGMSFSGTYSGCTENDYEPHDD